MQVKNPIINGKKKCNICGKIKLISKFGIAYNIKSGIRGECKSCSVTRTKKTRTPRKVRLYQVKRDFNLSPEEYDALIEQHNNCCALCNRPRESQARALHIDHCHTTGRIRGLLCTTCNWKLAWFENKQEQILRYLEGK